MENAEQVQPTMPFELEPEPKRRKRRPKFTPSEIRNAMRVMLSLDLHPEVKLDITEQLHQN